MDRTMFRDLQQTAALLSESSPTNEIVTSICSAPSTRERE
jgi:hypothetical protein